MTTCAQQHPAVSFAGTICPVCQEREHAAAVTEAILAHNSAPRCHFDVREGEAPHLCIASCSSLVICPMWRGAEKDCPYYRER